jgi:hypothetical protein
MAHHLMEGRETSVMHECAVQGHTFQGRGFEDGGLVQIQSVASGTGREGEGRWHVAAGASGRTCRSGRCWGQEETFAKILLDGVIREIGTQIAADRCQTGVERAVHRDHAAHELRQGALDALFGDNRASERRQEKRWIIIQVLQAGDDRPHPAMGRIEAHSPPDSGWVAWSGLPDSRRACPKTWCSRRRTGCW